MTYQDKIAQGDTRKEQLSLARVENIVNAMFMADNPHEVFQAIDQMPESIVLDLHNMCEHILKNKG